MLTADSTPDAIVRAIQETLAPIQSVQVAYLFGSRARGTARPDSDLDLAIALPRELDDAQRGRIKLEVIDALTATLGALGERADIVDLDRAGSAVAFAAIAQGRCAYVRDRPDRVRLEASIARRYDDERPYRELMHAAAIRATERMGTDPMVDADVLSRRLLSLNDARHQLTSRRPIITPEALSQDAALQAAVERWLQIAIEACIDSAYHVIADRGLTPPDSARGAFETLASEHIVTAALALKLGRAAGLRNILVHDYTRVDRTLLATIVHNDLSDLETFGAAIGALLKLG
jgi:uncharacterized protein YutE (UPF0331/DUF86 family)/predicted nucleotidyltransferase